MSLTLLYRGDLLLPLKEKIYKNHVIKKRPDQPKSHHISLTHFKPRDFQTAAIIVTKRLHVNEHHKIMVLSFLHKVSVFGAGPARPTGNLRFDESRCIRTCCRVRAIAPPPLLPTRCAPSANVARWLLSPRYTSLCLIIFCGLY